MTKKPARRDVLKGAAAIAGAGLSGSVFAAPARAQAPAASAITPELIAAAKKEGKVVFYTAMDLTLAQRLGREFEQRFPGISARVERSAESSASNSASLSSWRSLL